MLQGCRNELWTPCVIGKRITWSVYAFILWSVIKKCRTMDEGLLIPVQFKGLSQLVLEHNSGVSTWSRSKCCYIYPTLPHNPSTVTNVNGVAHTENAIHRKPLFTCGSIIFAQLGFESTTSQQDLPERQLCYWAHNLLEHNSGVSTWSRSKCCYIYPTVGPLRSSYIVSCFRVWTLYINVCFGTEFRTCKFGSLHQKLLHFDWVKIWIVSISDPNNGSALTAVA
jgi:hypothetical protein